MILLIVFLVTLSGPYDGLTERIFVSVVLIWIGISGVKFHSIARLRRKNGFRLARNI